MGKVSSDVPIYDIPPPERSTARAHRIARGFIERHPSASAGRLSAGVFGAGISLIIHSLLIGSVLWGGLVLNNRSPAHQGMGASASDSYQQPIMTLILINDPQATAKNPDLRDLPSRGLSPKDLDVRVLSPNAYPAVDPTHIDDAAQNQSAELQDAAERAALYGRYLGQVNARIERAWLRPRTPIGETLFKCEVSITQDKRGNVMEIALQDCNGDGRWQQSLVDAIQSASPLPTPPNPEVFSSTLTSRFESAAYSPGSVADGFEPAIRTSGYGSVPP